MKPFASCLIALLLVTCAGPQMQAPSPQRPPQYSANKMCEGCHVRIFQQYSESYHARAFSNPLFQGQYFKELLPRTGGRPDLLKEARGCIACHAPAAYMTLQGPVENVEQVGPDVANVTCKDVLKGSVWRAAAGRLRRRSDLS